MIQLLSDLQLNLSAKSFFSYRIFLRNIIRFHTLRVSSAKSAPELNNIRIHSTDRKVQRR